MKSAINLILVFIEYCLIGSMESNAMSMKTGLMLIGVVGLVAWLINRKKSATPRTRNGQAHNEQQLKCIQDNYTTKNRGVSSVF